VHVFYPSDAKLCVLWRHTWSVVSCFFDASCGFLTHRLFSLSLQRFPTRRRRKGSNAPFLILGCTIKALFFGKKYPDDENAKGTHLIANPFKFSLPNYCRSVPLDFLKVIVPKRCQVIYVRNRIFSPPESERVLSDRCTAVSLCTGRKNRQLARTPFTYCWRVFVNCSFATVSKSKLVTAVCLSHNATLQSYLCNLPSIE